MKTFANLLIGLFSVAVAAFLFTGCDDDDTSGNRLTELTYSDGEVALGQAYVSARPSVYAVGTPSFDLVRVKHNGTVLNDQTLMTIDASTGVITAVAVDDPEGIGEYLASVRVTDNGGSTLYDDAFRLVVKGILFGDTKVSRGEEKTFPVEGAYFVQEKGTVFSLVLPEGKTAEDYKGISIDPENCALVVDGTAEAGLYPISVGVKNQTNPEGTVFSDLATLIVESEPYGLAYDPARVTLVTSEGHVSAAPTVRAASETDGETVTYALANNFDGQFSIDAATGVISLPEENALPGEYKSYKLSVDVTNSLGTVTFTDVYEVILDPDKPIDPITGVSYPDAFPVELGPGEAWTSGRPTVTGAAIGVRYALVGAPEGVTIDERTGVISMAAGHRMPFAEDNKLTVSVKNSGMDEGFEAQVGDFFVNPVLWAVDLGTNSSSDATTNSGILNMDRYSFSGQIQSNQGKPETKPTTIQVKNAFGKAANPTVNGIVGVDFVGVNTSNTWPGNTNQNNDWLVSSEFLIPATSFHPAVQFNFLNQYGTDAQNILELYIVEINASNVYVKGEEAQDDRGMDAVPSDLPWVALATTDKNDGEIPAKIDYNLVSGGGSLQTFAPAPRSFDVSAYKGKSVRIAFRFWNPAATNNNSRTYRIESLRVEDRMTE